MPPSQDDPLLAHLAQHLSTAPAYPGAEPLSLEEVEAILDAVPPFPENPAVDGVQDLSPLAFPSTQRIRGDVVLDALHLPAEGSNLIIEGSLTVQGILRQSFRGGGLLVLGDLRAGHVVTTGDINVTGNLEVEGILYGNCTNYSTDVWGKTRAAALISVKEHYFCFWGGYEAAIVIDVYGDTPNLEARTHTEADMGSVLVDGAGDLFDADEVYALLTRHGTLLRA